MHQDDPQAHTTMYGRSRTTNRNAFLDVAGSLQTCRWQQGSSLLMCHRFPRELQLAPSLPD